MNYYDENKSTEYIDDFYIPKKEKIKKQGNKKIKPNRKIDYSKYLNKRNFIILGVLIIILVLGIIFFVYLKKNDKTNSYLKDITITNNIYSPKFSKDTYDYYILTEDQELEIKCDIDKNIDVEGCNEKINLSNYSNYIHEIIITEKNIKKIYKIYIKVKESDTEKAISIDSIEGINKNWTNKNQTITINSNSENKIISYSFDNGLTWQESPNFEVSENSNLKVIIEDEYGNQSAVRQIDINNIDKSLPIGTIIKEKSSKNEIVLKIIAKDELSGIDSYSWNDNDYTKKDTLTIKEKGNYYVTIKDKAGNISEKINIEIKDSDFNSKKQYSVRLYKNGSTNISSDFLKCTTNNNHCNVTLPTIERENSNILGWSKDKESKTAEYKPGEKISLENNITLYAITQKELTASFNKNGANHISSNKEKCTLYNDDEYCYIKTPNIIYDNGKIIGWNTEKNSKTILEGTNNLIKLYDNTTYYALIYEEVIILFETNGADSISSKKESCRIEQDSTYCYITMPTITRENSNILGWSTNKNDTNAEIKMDMELEVSTSKTYYAITEKEIKITFNKNGSDHISSTEEMCYFYNDHNSCQITTPTIIRNNSNIYGWSTNKNSKTAEIEAETTLNVAKNKTYYAISEKEVTAYFYENGADEISKYEQTCHFYNNENGCSITTPTITRTSYQIIGWNTNKNATTSIINQEKDTNIKKDTNYYAITSKELTATINLNTADSLGNCTTKTTNGCIERCKVYNTNENCQINLPYIYSKGNEVQFYSTGTNPETDVGYTPAKKLNIMDNITLNAIVYNKYRHNTYSIVKTKNYGYTAFETEYGCPTSVYNELYTFTDRFYKNVPYLFTAAKVTFTSNDSFIETWGNYSGMTYGKAIGYQNIDIRCPTTYSDYYIHTIVHEMVHAWNHYYQAKYGTYLSKMKDINNLYNKYKNLTNRPLRDYSYTNTIEFVSDMYSWYYFLYIDQINKPQIIEDNPNFPNDMKKTIEKYINIAKSNYN